MRKRVIFKDFYSILPKYPSKFIQIYLDERAGPMCLGLLAKSWGGALLIFEIKKNNKKSIHIIILVNIERSPVLTGFVRYKSASFEASFPLTFLH